MRAKSNLCVECGAAVWKRGGRCWGCYSQDRQGSKASAWKGGRHLSHGYIKIYIGAREYEYEHVLIAERALGRPLRNGEIVHHINGDKQDNRNANLLICTSQYHAYLHSQMAELYQRAHFPKA